MNNVKSLVKRPVAIALALLVLVSGGAMAKSKAKIKKPKKPKASYTYFVKTPMMPYFTDQAMTQMAGAYPQWTIIGVVKIKEDVAGIYVGGKPYYAKASDLATPDEVFTNSEKFKTWKTKWECRVFQSPSTTAKYATVPMDTCLISVAQRGDWLMVKSTDGKKLGYIYSENLVKWVG